MLLTVDPGDGDALEGGDEDDDTRPGVVVEHLEHEHSSLKYKQRRLQPGFIPSWNTTRMVTTIVHSSLK